MEAIKWAEDKRNLCQRISMLHSYLREMKTEYAPKSIEDSAWSPHFKLAVDDFETVDYYYELFMIQTNHIKSIVTVEDQIDLERKGQQSFKGVVYARLIAFGNGGLHALYDKTDGFYRRQLILTTKDKVEGKEDDPYLIDKLREERDGIFLWELEGLHRLMANNFVFSESDDVKQNLVDAQEEGNNILAFMKSEGYVQFEIGKKISSLISYMINCQMQRRRSSWEPL